MRRAVGFCLCFLVPLTGCVEDPGTTPRTSADNGIQQSEELLVRFLHAEEAGCSAAVAHHGEVTWAGSLGLSNLATEQPLTAESEFDFASVSKQFTALAVLLLEEDGSLSMSDSLADWAPGLPAWAQDVTLVDLMHHESGIPDYIEILGDEGVELTDHSTQQDAVDAIASVQELENPPGTAFDYSTSNHILLAEVAEEASATPLAEFFSTPVYEGFNLHLEPGRESSVQSYEDGQVVTSGWQQVGDGSVHGTPSELVRWADRYRTRPVGVTNSTGYGAGLEVSPNGELSHAGSWAGSTSAFGVSPDRNTTLAVTCNSADAPVFTIARGLRTIWMDDIE